MLLFLSSPWLLLDDPLEMLSVTPLPKTVPPILASLGVFLFFVGGPVELLVVRGHALSRFVLLVAPPLEVILLVPAQLVQKLLSLVHNNFISGLLMSIIIVIFKF